MTFFAIYTLFGILSLRKRIKELAAKKKRYGCPRITYLLRREGWEVNKKRVHRIWKAEGLSLPQRRPKRRRCGRTVEIVNRATHRNHVWSYDFVEDRTENAYVESFNGKFRDECLNREAFRNGSELNRLLIISQCDMDMHPENSTTRKVRKAVKYSLTGVAWNEEEKVHRRADSANTERSA